MKIEQEKRFENINKPPHSQLQSAANEMSKQAETDQAPSSQRKMTKKSS